MSLYLNTTTLELRDLPESYLADLVAAGNPKAQQWQPAPPKPSDDAVWSGGQWVQPPAPTYTAEDWLANQGYTPLRLLTCLDLEAKLRAAGAASPTLAAVRQWLDALTLAAAAAPDQQRPDWPPAPHPFETVLAATLAILAP